MLNQNINLTNYKKNFMAYYPSSTSTPAILSETILSTIGSVGLQWMSNPIATELEVIVMDWLAKMVDIKGPFLHSSNKGGGIIQNTTSEAILNIIICSKFEKKKQILLSESINHFPFDSVNNKIDDYKREELYYSDSSKLVVYTSEDAHFCVIKKCRIANVSVRK